MNSLVSVQQLRGVPEVRIRVVRDSWRVLLAVLGRTVGLHYPVSVVHHHAGIGAQGLEVDVEELWLARATKLKINVVSSGKGKKIK